MMYVSYTITGASLLRRLASLSSGSPGTGLFHGLRDDEMAEGVARVPLAKERDRQQQVRRRIRSALGKCPFKPTLGLSPLFPLICLETLADFRGIKDGNGVVERILDRGAGRPEAMLRKARQRIQSQVSDAFGASFMAISNAA
jgi:hypothetical protein